MLDPEAPLRKDSFRAGPDRSGVRGDSSKPRKSSRLARVSRDRAIAAGRAGFRRTALRTVGRSAQRGCPAMRARHSRRSPGSEAAAWIDVGLDREAILEHRGEDAHVRIEAQIEERSAADVAGEVDPLGDGHLGQAPERGRDRPPGGSPGCTARRPRGPRGRARRGSRRGRARRRAGVRGCAASARRTAWNLRASRSARISWTRLEGQVAPPQQPEAVSLGPHPPYCPTIGAAGGRRR